MIDAKARCYGAAFSGLVGGLWVGAGITFVGAPWKMMALCAMLGVAIGTILYPKDGSMPLARLLVMGRSLGIEFRLFFSSLFIAIVCIIYSGSDDIPLHMAFAIFLVPIILSVILFGALFAYLIPLFSSIALLYFVIPPRNSFAIETTRDFLNLCVFVSLAWITWAILTLQSIFTGIEEG